MDPGSGTTARWLVRFGYDGAKFAGWARQPGLRTVEGEIRRGAVRCGVVASPESLRLEVASRTDRGVHARANVLALSSDLSGPALLRALNGVAGDLFFDRARPIPESFQVRRAVRRWYRYYEPREGRNMARWRRTARRFRGPIDARNFGRGLPIGSEAMRPIERITVRSEGPWILVEVRAPSFAWGMVRKIVGAMRALDEGRLSETALDDALRGARRLSLPMAEPDRLVLWRLDHGVRWTVRAPRGPSRGGRRFRALRIAAAARSAILEAIEPGRPRSSGRGTGKTEPRGRYRGP